ncbi:sulfotransferase family protein [Fulvivirga sedimenti]|uniref:Sulfotransferase n=1 Tax=Fulvivirga sedimenti TaxID=2879465 RepID=A0A9X1L1Z9_9BACT|nr:sulfotransferase [Fulvivirga sedimenti]MCA6079204.1 sulfotransferase [Fulvivirga sedimenti]
MSKKSFKLPPLSPLIGTNLINYIRISRKRKIAGRYWLKYILTILIILIFTPLRWYERWYLRKKRSHRIEKPVFILGHWRSGTTLLHNLLCQSPNAAFVTTYQTVFTQYLGSSKILKPFMGFIMPDKRPSDNVKLNVDYPQEEEFALCNLTEASYYHFFYFPDDTTEYFDRYVRFSHGADKWKNSYAELLRRAGYIMRERPYLVIKNPVNTGRLGVLRELYPDGRFIHIYRNPYVVFLSTKKFFLELMPTLWFHEFSEEDIEEMILETYLKLMELYDRDHALNGQVVDVKFEEFEKNPLESLKNIYEQLGMTMFEQDRSSFESYLASQKGYRKNKYSISRREYDLVTNRWQVYLERWNYGLPPNMEIVD